MPSMAISSPTPRRRPGLIVDCLVTKADVLDDRLAEFRALARAWDAALEYVKAHPDEANEIMARNVGGWLEDPAVFAETLKGVRFYDSARNREYFGTPDHPARSTRPRNTASTSGRALACSRRTLRRPT